MTEDEFDAAARRLLDALGAHFGLPPLEWRDGGCAVTLGNGQMLALYPEYAARCVLMHVFAGVAPLDGPRSKDLFRELLEANNGWERTQGATLGMDGETGLVSLWLRFPLPAEDETEIPETVQALLDAADHWRAAILEYGGQPVFEETAPEAVSAGTMVKA